MRFDDDKIVTLNFSKEDPMNSKNLCLRLIALCIWLSAIVVRAEVPNTMSYQGVLKEDDIPVPDGSYSLTFRLYADTTQPALWTETQSLTTSGGVFSAILGTVSPLNLPFDQQYYLGTTVGGDPEMTPRVKLASAPYALNAKGSGGWTVSGNDVVTSGTGRVGIGVTNPRAKLDVAGELIAQHFTVRAINGHPNNGWNWDVRNDVGGVNDDLKLLRYWGEGYFGGIPFQVQNSTGNVGIGESNPNLRLDIQGDFGNDNGPATAYLMGSTLSDVGDGKLRIRSGGSTVVFDGSDNVGIGTDNPQYALDVSGDIHASNVATTGPFGTTLAHASLELGGPTGFTPFIDFHNSDVAGEDYDTRIIATTPNEIAITGGNLRVTQTTITDVLQVTGGSDLAEPFSMSVSDVDIFPGAVVVIDPDNPGTLRVSKVAYDTKVAGVVSGAGGVNPGLILNQADILGEGKNVALSGRVYVRADASSGAIVPGDLLTTSALAGHAMKVVDQSRAHGAVIGKAMTSLESGQGLVLVLVNLQ